MKLVQPALIGEQRGTQWAITMRVLILALVTALVLGACDTSIGALPIRNTTDQELTIIEYSGGGQVLRSESLQPGGTFRFDAQQGSAGPFLVQDENEKVLLAIEGLAIGHQLPFVITEEDLVGNVVNGTDETLVLVYESIQQIDFEYAQLAPGDAVRPVHDTRRGCHPSTLVIRTIDGDEYAREPHRICSDDAWVITRPDS